MSSQSHYAWLESYSPLIKKSGILLLASLLLSFISSFLGTFGSVAFCYILTCAYPNIFYPITYKLNYLFYCLSVSIKWNFFYKIIRGLIITMKPHLRWRIEMIQPPPPSIRLYHAALGLSFGLALCIFIKYPFIFLYIFIIIFLFIFIVLY